MNTRSRKISVSLAIIAALLIASLAHAEPQRGLRIKINPAGQGRFHGIVQELNLSPQQQQQIAERRSKEKQQIQEFIQQLKACRQELNRELEKATPERAKVSKLVAQMKELIGMRIAGRVEGILFLKKTLTPEQFKVLQDKTRKSIWIKRRQS